MAEEGEEPPVEQLKEVPPLTEEEVEARAAIFDDIFKEAAAQDMKGKSINERKENALEGKALTYAEFDFHLMTELFTKIKTNFGPVYEKGIFLDLGSGVGKACIAAALQHPFEKVVGVEILQGLSEVATASLAKYQEAQLPEGEVKPELQLIKGDFVGEFEAHVDSLLPQVTFCLAVASCYGEKEIQALVAAARKMPANSFFVTFTQPLPESFVIDDDRHPRQRRAAAVRKACSKRGVEPCPPEEIQVEPPQIDPDGVTLVHKEVMQVPWGEPATCFIYKKMPKPELVEEAPETEGPA
mmetsp:Transcript_127697/g.408835  ORF Transcript_127697/g.408835 Transcript_127697/m.408835 type:complete len:298 (-) Transcript_127697:164-1057(-)